MRSEIAGTACRARSIWTGIRKGSAAALDEDGSDSADPAGRRINSGNARRRVQYTLDMTIESCHET